MSMPIIQRPENPIDRGQSINDLIGSVALVETGLSHIINAEGEKIQKFVDPDADYPIADIINVNNSVERMVNTVSKLEMILQNKLDIVKEMDTESRTITTTGGLSAQHLAGGSLFVSPEGTPLTLETVTYINGITVNATSDTFTVNADGSYLIKYLYVNGSDNVNTFNMALKINGVIDPNTIFYFQGNTQFDRQIFNSIILDLTAGSTVQVVLTGLTEEKEYTEDASASLVILKVA